MPASRRITVRALEGSRVRRVRLVGSYEQLEWSADGGELTVTLPERLPLSAATALDLGTDVRARLRARRRTRRQGSPPVILDLFLIGLVVTLEPIPLTAMILLLASERGLLKGLGFTLGWLLTLVLIVAVTVLITGGKPLIPHSSPSTAALAVKLACGVVLVLVAVRRQARPARTDVFLSLGLGLYLMAKSIYGLVS